MNVRTAGRIVAPLLLLFLAAAPRAGAQQGPSRPLLSEEIRTVLEKDGIEAAQARFREIVPAEKDAWEIDPQGLGALGGEYVQAGDMATAQAVMEMMTVAMQEAMAAGGSMDMSAMMGSSDLQAAAEAQRRADAEAAAQAPAPRDVPAYDPGPSRDDLARFFGVYGPAATGDDGSVPRTLFVTRSCDGRLVAGPMWADVAPWFMKSESDATFSYADQWNSVRLEFQLGADGSAEGVVHDVDGLPSPAPRTGPLPDGWEKCVMPQGG